MSSACFVSVSDAMKNSLNPVKLPLGKAKKTLEPAPIGLTSLSFSNSVVTSILTFSEVKVFPPVNINCVWSENKSNSSSNEIA